VTARQRMLTVRLMEKLQKHPDYTRQLGLSVKRYEIDPVDKFDRKKV